MVITVLLLIYSSIVTPIFEELIFHGYIWNKLNEIFSSEWITYLISSILFGIWHIGYIETLAFHSKTEITDYGIINIIFWKVITGLCFGFVLGIVRKKTKNCYSTILLHGLMNVFGK